MEIVVVETTKGRPQHLFVIYRLLNDIFFFFTPRPVPEGLGRNYCGTEEQSHVANDRKAGEIYRLVICTLTDILMRRNSTFARYYKQYEFDWFLRNDWQTHCLKIMDLYVNLERAKIRVGKTYY